MLQQINIYQIYYDEHSKEKLDEAFIPFDNRCNLCPQEREFYIYRKYFEHNQNITAKDHYWGFVSWKFNAKTEITGKEFIDFIRDHPGYDAYFINPFPEVCFVPNPWQEGEMHHPGITELAKKLLPNLSDQLDVIQNTTLNTGRCNFFVGNHWFWNAYFSDFCFPAYQRLQSFSKAEYEMYFMPADITRKDASYFPFIFERFFSTFLALTKKTSYLGYQYSEAQLKKKLKNDERSYFSEAEIQQYYAMLSRDKAASQL